MDMSVPGLLKIKIAFLFSVFAMYWAGGTLFIHKHTFDGVTIVHSHPFSDSSHHHKVSDLRWIDMLSHFCTDDFCVQYPILKSPYIFIAREFALLTDEITVSDVIRHIRLRAPPVL